MRDKKNNINQDAFSHLSINRGNKIITDPEPKTITNITILPELQDLIPPLSNDEFLQLEQNIIAEGCREPLIVWKNEDQYILVDGHNRHRICQKHNIEFKTSTKNFSNLEDAQAWMIANQLGRRNLNPDQLSFLRGLQYMNEKNRVGVYDHSQSGKNFHSTEKTGERLAAEHNVSEKTIRNDEKFARGLIKLDSLNKDLKQQILAGKIKARKKDISELATLDIDTESLPFEINSIKDITDLINEISPKTESLPENSAIDLCKQEMLSSIKQVYSKYSKNQKIDQQEIETIKRLLDDFLDLLNTNKS